MEINQNKNKIALTLMTISLLLLGIFLAFWVKNLYQEEVSQLEERGTFVFINTMREAEINYIKEDMLAPVLATLKEKQDSVSLTAFSIEMTNDDTIPMKSTYSMFDSTGINIETKISFQIENEENVQGEKGSNIGGFISWMKGDYQADTINNYSQQQIDSLVENVLNNLVTTSPKWKDLPETYKIIKITDSLKLGKTVMSEYFKDQHLGDKYALTFDEVNGFIFQKLLPQILFSLLLFSITSLAFFFIYKSLKEQQRLTALKNDLISNITHELKTPIATVGVAIEALQNFGALEDQIKTKEYLDISQQELNRLSILVDKVLNTSLFERQDFPLKKETINLKTIVKGVLNTMKLQFQHKKAVFTFKAEGSNFEIKGDKIHLTSVIYNLVDNAIKYSPLSPNLKIALIQEEGSIRFSIKDNGIGIPEDYQEKIFEKFFRVPSNNDHSIKGHGLGLNYVKKVIEKHRGEITVNSILNQGTQFVISLPINT